jgi:DNA-binding MarR family transcriptional regulator
VIIETVFADLIDGPLAHCLDGWAKVPPASTPRSRILGGVSSVEQVVPLAGAEMGDEQCGNEAGFEADLGWAIGIIARTFRQWAISSVSDLPGGPRGYLVLTVVSQGRPRSQLALAQQLGVDKTAMTYLLDDLEGAGLVERRPDPADRRARQVGMTPKGRRLLGEFRDRLAAAEDKLLSVLKPNEISIFRDMIERVARSAQATTSAECGEGHVVLDESCP